MEIETVRKDSQMCVSVVVIDGSRTHADVWLVHTARHNPAK